MAVPFNGSGATAADDPDIVVTARKRNERLQDVPMAVSAVSAQALLDRNQVRIEDYAATLPGLSYKTQGNGQTFLSIRGLSTGDAGTPAVGVTIDDVPFGSSTIVGYGMRILPDIDPANLDHVEVLSGPQGTLYGSASVGGLLKFVTAEPSTSGLSGRAEISTTAVDQGGVGYELRDAINVPLSNEVAVRASGYFRRDPGYVDNIATRQNDINHANNSGGLLSLLARPSSAVTVRLNALIQDQRGFGSSEVDANYRLQSVHGDLDQTLLNGTGSYRINAKLYWSIVNADLSFADLKSITAYGTTRYSGPVDIGTSYARFASLVFGPSYTRARLFNDFSTNKFTQEVRLSKSGNRLMDWELGFFYDSEKTHGRQSLQGVDPDDGAVGGDLLLQAFPSTYRETAVFGDVTVHVTPRFDVQMGGRYNWTRQVYDETDSGFLNGGTSTSPTQRTSADTFTYLVNPRYRVNEDMMAYLRFASGYRVGGPNPGAADFGYNQAFRPDKAIDYEAGLKGSLINKAIEYDLALYYIDWNNIQLTLRDPATGFGFFANGSDAVSKGIELSLRTHPARKLTVGINLSVNDAKLTSALPAGLAVGDKGDRLPFSSPFGASLTVDQRMSLGGNVTGFVGGTVTYAGRRLGNFARTAADIRSVFPNYATLALRAGIETGGWRFGLYADNLTDTRGILSGRPTNLSGIPDQNSAFNVTYILPRSFGLTASKTF